MESTDTLVALGRLQAQAEETTRQLTALFKCIDALLNPIVTGSDSFNFCILSDNRVFTILNLFF